MGGVNHDNTSAKLVCSLHVKQCNVYHALITKIYFHIWSFNLLALSCFDVSLHRGTALNQLYNCSLSNVPTVRTEFIILAALNVTVIISKYLYTIKFNFLKHR